MKKINVSIVLYKTSFSDIVACLDSLIKSKSINNIFLIDNSPCDGLREVSEIYKNTIYIHNPSNPGYGAGHNVGIKEGFKTGVDYHLVLNPDIFFNEDIFTGIIEFMDSNSEVGHLMPKILNRDGSIQHLCKLVPSPVDLIIKRFFPKFILVRLRSNFILNLLDDKRVMFVPYLSGCFMFLRYEALKAVGLFDERFFMYPEDIDLTRRIAIRFDTVFYPLVSVTHGYEGASYKSYRMLYIHIKNTIKYFNKWGWFFDCERKALNKKTLSQFEEVK